MQNFSEIEKKILKFWQKNKIFEKSLKQRKNCPIFSFYDGPPFATGSPHYGHILASTIKDVIPRYWTMKGYYVPRRWGWDCHGLPIENIIEEKMKISGKKEIEEMGIKKFNNSCRKSVLTCSDKWKKMINRIGRFVDFENSYKTMDIDYIESVWWAIKEIWKKGLIYEGRKVLLYCSRCESPISNFEVAMDNSYQEITEESVFVKFKISKSSKTCNLKPNTYLLAWTTTPWTLPGNMALAVNRNLAYILAEQNGESYLIAESRKGILGKGFKILKKYKGKDLKGIKYEPLYRVKGTEENKNKHQVLLADFVSAEEGTGIVHIAPVYGEDDYKLGIKFNLPIIPLLNNKGHFNKDAPKIIYQQFFKKADSLIKDNLFQRNLIYKKEKISHSYPFCWRCDTILFYNAIPAWFINIQKIKRKLIELNKNINWYPSHLKYGRFLKGLEGAPDWTISRNRYWASPLPFWKCQNKECQKIKVIGSIRELEIFNISKKKLKDIHRPFIDDVVFRCNECGGIMKRVSEVADCWLEAASMPFAELHYPFQNKKQFENRFPAHFISEYIPQTRAWFYVMHVVSAILFDKAAFKNVIATGTILNEEGKKMSKSKKNFPNPWEMIDRYGADALRFYLMSSSAMKGENLFFSEKELKEIYQKNILLLLNVLAFYQEYQVNFDKNKILKPIHILDKWILSRLNCLISETTNKMDNYDVVSATREIKEFISDLSLWYLRRSRDRFKKGDIEGIKIFGYTLSRLSLIIAPFTPFLADHIYQNLKTTKNYQSVHLGAYPKPNKKLINKELNQKMEKIREIVSLALAERAKAGIKVKQPIASLKIKNQKRKRQRSVEGETKSPRTSKIKNNELLELIKEEVNVKKIVFDSGIKKEVELDTKITPKLKEEGVVREIIRQIQEMRKKTGLKPKDEIMVEYLGSEKKLFEKNQNLISEQTNIKKLALAESKEELITIKKI